MAQQKNLTDSSYSAFKKQSKTSTYKLTCLENDFTRSKKCSITFKGTTIDNFAQENQNDWYPICIVARNTSAAFQ